MDRETFDLTLDGFRSELPENCELRALEFQLEGGKWRMRRFKQQLDFLALMHGCQVSVIETTSLTRAIADFTISGPGVLGMRADLADLLSGSC